MSLCDVPQQTTCGGEPDFPEGLVGRRRLVRAISSTSFCQLHRSGEFYTFFGADVVVPSPDRRESPRALRVSDRDCTNPPPGDPAR